MPGMSQRLEVKVLCPGRWSRGTREALGHDRDLGSEGSMERMRGATDRNLIRGLGYPDYRPRNSKVLSPSRVCFVK